MSATRAFGVLLLQGTLMSCLGETLTLSPELDASDGSAITDAGNEGDSDACAGRNCLGGGCIEGKCQPLVIVKPDLQFLPQSLAVDPAPDGGVFYTNLTLDQGYASGLWRVEKDGSKPHAIAGPGYLKRSIDVVFDNHRLYFSTYNPDGPSPVLQVSDKGTGLVELGGKSYRGSWFLSLDASHVYWANRYDAVLVARAPKAGGPSETVVEITPDAGPPTGTLAVEVDAGVVYWATSGEIWKRDVSGITKQLASSLTIADIEVDTDYVYFCGASRVGRLKKDGTQPSESLYPTARNAARLALDDGYLYWSEEGEPDFSNGRIQRKKLDGSAPVETVVDGLFGAHGIAFDESAMYYAETKAQKVWKLAK